MTELFENIVSLLANEQSSRALGEEFRIKTAEAAASAAELCVPVVLANLNRFAADPSGATTLVSALRSVETSGLVDTAPAIRAGLYEPFGSELVQTLFGATKQRVAGIIAAGAGISESSAQWLLSPVSWAIMATIVQRHGNRLAEPALITILRQEYLDLLEGGWEPWLTATGEPNYLSTDDSDPGPANSQSSRAKRLHSPGKYPPPVRPSERFSPKVIPGLQESSTISPNVDSFNSDQGIGASGPMAAERNRVSSEIRSGGDRIGVEQHRDDHRSHWSSAPDRQRANLPIVLSLAVAATFGALAWLVLFRDRSEQQIAGSQIDESQQQSDDRGDTNPPTPDPASSETEQIAPTSTDGSAAAPVSGTSAVPNTQTTNIEPGERPIKPATDTVVTFNVSLSDPSGQSNATGSAEILLDAEASEACYDIATEGLEVPYDSFVHIGPETENGPIVAAFGSLSAAATGCINVASTNLAAVAADRAGHYLALHGPGGDTDLRAQLGDEVEGDPVRQPPSNQQRNGARAVVEIGRITLKGAVADQATVDLLNQEFSTVDLTRTELVNELRIVAGTPPPSGLIEVNDEILFELASATLGPVQGTVIEDLANLFRARPDWTMAVVGHTDNTGDAVANLELSLKRADAVRSALINLGVDPDNLRTQGAGDTDAIFSNRSVNGQARNRRIEFKVDTANR